MQGMKALTIVLGVVMLGFGLYFSTYVLVNHGQPRTTSIWLDMLLAAFCYLRGTMNIRRALRRRAA